MDLKIPRQEIDVKCPNRQLCKGEKILPSLLNKNTKRFITNLADIRPLTLVHRFFMANQVSSLHKGFQTNVTFIFLIYNNKKVTVYTV